MCQVNGSIDIGALINPVEHVLPALQNVSLRVCTLAR